MPNESATSPTAFPTWEGAPSFFAAAGLANKLVTSAASASPEDQLIASFLSGALGDAHPIHCPPSQLNAIDDDIFPNLASAVDYARQARMPFEFIYLDFTPDNGEQPVIVDLSDGENKDAAAELAGVAIAENPEVELTVMVPVVKMPNKRIYTVSGMPYLLWNDPAPETDKQDYGTLPVTWWEGKDLEARFFNGPAVQWMLKDDGPPAAGGYFGALHESRIDYSSSDPGKDPGSQYSLRNAAVSALVMNLALKVLFLLDSTNIELAPVALSRQSRRQAERKGTGIASTIRVKRSKKAEPSGSGGQSVKFDHQFEVRGNFAHYGPDTKLYRHSDPVHIHPCPRCGTCRRIWRPPHIKGPTDKPLVVKVRRIDALEEKT